MSDPFVGQVIAVGFNFAPVGWHLCDGSVLPISQYQALFSLLGTTFGGDGQTTFGLPDLRGRTVIGGTQGAGPNPYALGQVGGVESVTLTSNQIAGHTHGLMGAATTTAPEPGSALVLGTPEAATPMYASSGNGAGLSGGTVTASAGGGLGHENRQPSTVINYIISLDGIYPSRS
jgi:microcystin-dependent protein